MKLIPITKKHIYYLIGFAVLIFIAAVAIAQSSAPNPGHAADEIGEGTIANTLTVTGGNVGIGMTAGGATSALKFFDGTTTAFSAIINPSSAGLRFLTNNGNTDAMSILSNGNVGIGTTSPGAKLDVAGNVIVSQGISFTGSLVSGTGIGSSGSNGDLRLYAGGTQYVTVQNNGYVGIGTTNPQGKLHIYSSVGAGTPSPYSSLVIEDSGSRYLTFNGPNTGSEQGILWANSGSGADGSIVFSSTYDAIFLGTSGYSPTMSIKGGNVGIGTTSPAKNLHIKGDAGAGIRIEETGWQDWDIIATHGAGSVTRLDFARSNGATTIMSIVEASVGGGNVGIGTVNPNSKLQIGTPGAAGREYLQIDMESNAPASAPPSTDCDAQNEGGRMVYDDSNKRIWVCDGQLGWRYASTIQ